MFRQTLLHNTFLLIILLLPTIQFARIRGTKSSDPNILGLQDTYLDYSTLVLDNEVPLVSMDRNIISGVGWKKVLIFSNELLHFSYSDPTITISEPTYETDRYVYEMDFYSLEEFRVIKFKAFDEAGNTAPLLIFSNLYKLTLDIQNEFRDCINTSQINITDYPVSKDDCILADDSASSSLVLFDGRTKINLLVYDDLVNMLESAESENVHLKINSAFRSTKDQEIIQSKFQKWYGSSKAEKLVADPGHSEHHLGTAIDIGSTRSSASFEKTQEYEWLRENAWRYGFVMSYPNLGTERTGYEFEPWHWRYVGKHNAENMKKMGDLFTPYEYLYIINSDEYTT